MLKVAIRGILAKKLRVVLTSIAIVLGVAFMAGTLVLSDTITHTFDTLAVQVNTGLSATVRAKAAFKSEGQQQRNWIDASLLDTVKNVPGVQAASLDVQGLAFVVGRDGKAITKTSGAPGLGFAWDPNSTLRAVHLISGKPPEQPNDIVIDKHSADQGHFKIGDQVRIVVSSANGGSNLYRLTGIVKFGSVDSPLGATLTFFTQPTAERLLTAPGKVTSIDVAASSGTSQTVLAQRLRQALTGQKGIEVITGQAAVKEQQDNFQTFIKFIKTFLLVFAIIALLVGSFVIYNTFSITIAQRTREMALLRSIGAGRGQILGSVFLEALATGLVASIVGVVGGIGLAVGLKALLSGIGFDIPATSPVVTVGTILTAGLTGVIVTLLAAMWPAVRASRVPPIAALRDVAVESTKLSKRRLVIGLIVTLLGVVSLLQGLFGGGSNALPKVGGGALLVFIGVTILGPVFARPAARIIGAPLPKLRGITGRLARENAMRNPKRTSATAAALMIGVGLVGFVTVFAASATASVNHAIDQSMKADYIVNVGGFGTTLPPSIETQLGAVPGIERATGLKIGPAKVDGSVQQLQATDLKIVNSLFDLQVKDGSLASMGDHGLAVDKKVAKDKGWKLGSKVPVQFTLTGHTTFTIQAIYSQPAFGSYVISLPAYQQNFADQSDVSVFVKAKPGVSAASVRPALEKVMDKFPQGKLENRQEFKNDQKKQITQLLTLIYALLLMAIIIALFGIGVTLALSIYERTREIGLLRAVGMSRAQVRSTVRWESVIIALFGTVLGLIIGVFFGWALVHALADQGLNRLALPPGQLIILLVLGALVGSLAAWSPARRAAKLDILQAIVTE
ncbi:MAG TPA: FtsX-like permease family protein [Acidimicrobiia bacterium]|jgi:putative ABC transport system permease protein|nr:FtsX-like permease family protein [Acidimicrobiia bacterium]